MLNRVGVVLALALLSGGLAAFLAFTYLRQPPAPVDSEGNPSTVTVAVAARNLEMGAVLQPEDVRLVDWPGRAVPAGYSISAAEVVGRGLLTPVKTNEPLLSSKLALKEAGGGLPIVIPEGRRGLSVRVDDVIGVAGFVLPGTRVDVLVTLDQQAQQDIPVTQIVLQNIQVLSAGARIDRDERGEPQQVPVVTLLVTPEEAEKLALASTKGRIQLALRNTLDLDTVATPGIRVTGLITSRTVPSGPSRAVVPRSSRISVEVYKGTEQTSVPVDRPREGGS